MTLEDDLRQARTQVSRLLRRNTAQDRIVAATLTWRAATTPAAEIAALQQLRTAVDAYAELTANPPPDPQPGQTWIDASFRQGRDPNTRTIALIKDADSAVVNITQIHQRRNAYGQWSNQPGSRRTRCMHASIFVKRWELLSEPAGNGTQSNVGAPAATTGTPRRQKHAQDD